MEKSTTNVEVEKLHIQNIQYILKKLTFKLKKWQGKEIRNSLWQSLFNLSMIQGFSTLK
jgi:hypothetical protein